MGFGGISIHAAREGGDEAAAEAVAQRGEISIHAAREGGDLGVIIKASKGKDFNPRRP